MGLLNTRNIIGIGALVGYVSQPEPPYQLPNSEVDSIVLNYSGLGLDATDTDILINALYDTGFATNCVIDFTGNSVPTAASAAAISGLEADGNVVIIDTL